MQTVLRNGRYRQNAERIQSIMAKSDAAGRGAELIEAAAAGASD